MTDPMTPVRALIEAAGKHNAGDHARYPLVNEKIAVAIAALAATASISQLLSEHDKVVALIAELSKPYSTLPIDLASDMSKQEIEFTRGIAKVMSAKDNQIAKRLAAIVEGK